jgi:hypothetical protein
LIGAGNCCCCLWVVLGGALAGYLLCSSSAKPVRPGEGALVGVFAGLIGGMITSLAQALRQMINPDQFRSAMEEAIRQQGMNIPPEAEQVFDQMMSLFSNPILVLGVYMFFTLLIFAIMAMLGAIIAIEFFEPRFALSRVATGEPVMPNTQSAPAVNTTSAFQPAPVQSKAVWTPNISSSDPGAGEPEMMFPRKPKEDS